MGNRKTDYEIDNKMKRDCSQYVKIRTCETAAAVVVQVRRAEGPEHQPTSRRRRRRRSRVIAQVPRAARRRVPDRGRGSCGGGLREECAWPDGDSALGAHGSRQCDRAIRTCNTIVVVGSTVSAISGPIFVRPSVYRHRRYPVYSFPLHGTRVTPADVNDGAAAACADDEPPPMATTSIAATDRHRHHCHYHYSGRQATVRPQQQQQQPDHNHQYHHHHHHHKSSAAKKFRVPGAADGGGGGGSKKKTSAGNRRRRLTHVLAGIVLGLFVGYTIGGGSYDRFRLYAGCGGRPVPTSAALRPLRSTAAPDNGTAAADEKRGDTSTATESLLFVGVMTADRYLATRAAAVHNTWARRVPGRVVFYSSAASVRPAAVADLPLVPLPTVDDSYPPQKKSFLMLQHMWDNYGAAYEWFMRADDDVYVRPDRLAALLRSVDSRKPVFIGQAGRGNQEEFGLLSLEYDENFCMGGPGVIMSRETLARVVPHVKHCLRNLFTAHEDVELGRCVQKYAGVSCTWSYEVTHRR